VPPLLRLLFSKLRLNLLLKLLQARHSTSWLLQLLLLLQLVTSIGIAAICRAFCIPVRCRVSLFHPRSSA
jgi:hypothetical protein